MEPNEDENELNDGIKKDKIFDNEYESTEYDYSSTTFKVEDSYREKSIDEKIDENLVKEQVKSSLRKNPKFRKFSEPDDKGEYQKINKNEINEIYSYVINDLPNMPKIEIFSSLTDFYDVSPEKFYESLSNSFKTQLIIDLRNRGYLRKRNFLF